MERQTAYSGLRVVTEWDSEGIRQMCMENGWYTHGNNKDYSEMLNFVDENEMTSKTMLDVACDIFRHSMMSEYTEDGEYINEDIEGILFEIGRKATRRFVVE